MSDGALSEGRHSAFVWKTNKRDGDMSPWFKTQQREFFLYFRTGWNGESDYRLRLSNEESPPSPFDVSVFLIVGEESACAPCTTTVRQIGHTIVWTTKKSDLSKIDPDFERKTFRFVIVVHDPGAPGQEHTAKVAKTEGEQAGRYKESAFTSKGLKETEDIAIQTAAYSDSNFEIESLSSDLSKLLKDHSNNDVRLVCGGVTFNAHKIILGVRSDVFRAMLETEMSENESGTVQIKDVEPEMLQVFLEYLYSAKLKGLNFQTAVELYKLGDKYAVGCLKMKCGRFLADNLASCNASTILSLAYLHSDEHLQEIATSYVVDQKIPLQGDNNDWSSFKVNYPLLAVDVTTRLCKKLDSNK